MFHFWTYTENLKIFSLLLLFGSSNFSESFRLVPSRMFGPPSPLSKSRLNRSRRLSPPPAQAQPAQPALPGAALPSPRRFRSQPAQPVRRATEEPSPPSPVGGTSPKSFEVEVRVSSKKTTKASPQKSEAQSENLMKICLDFSFARRNEEHFLEVCAYHFTACLVSLAIRKSEARRFPQRLRSIHCLALR